MKQIRLIGDCHGEYKHYFSAIKNCDYSIQLGDMAFDYTPLNKVDYKKHKCYFGNHDRRDCNPPPHWLGDYGEFELNSIKGFFIAGAASVDKKWRIQHELETGQKIWWEDEELNLEQMEKAFQWYKENKPDLMLTHDCPQSISKKIGNPNVLISFGLDPNWTNPTQILLEACLNYHKPKLWVGGHYHLYKDLTIGRTQFICLNMIPRYRYFIDVNENLEIILKETKS